MTFAENINTKKPQKRVLIAPLDWGLGHATRCIPLITILKKNNAEVFVASSGAVAELIRGEFPEVNILDLDGYGIRYSKKKSGFLLKIFLQLPRIYRAVKKENRLLKKLVDEYRFDVIISDNRLGFHHHECHSVYITHQLAIKTGSRFLDKWAQKVNYHYINKFDECWVPDMNGPENLAGSLSHPQKMPEIPVHYIGLLSRFKKTYIEKTLQLTILISGPEPQRTVFEKIIFEQIKSLKIPITIVRGIPQDEQVFLPPAENAVLFNHLKAEELNHLLQQSEMVVARSGYSTIMDLISLGQRAMLIPTPGQTEQEYLARNLFEKGIFYAVNQQDLDLKKNLEALKDFKHHFPSVQTEIETFINEWIKKI